VVLDPLRLYQERDAKDRGTSRGLLIPTEEQYRERLSIAAGLNEEVRPVSVLDLGCGYADLADQLPADLAYVGVEMTPWIYQEARRRHPDLMLFQARIENLHAEAAFDVVVLLGVLATTSHSCWPELAQARSPRTRAVSPGAGAAPASLQEERFQGRSAGDRDRRTAGRCGRRSLRDTRRSCPGRKQPAPSHTPQASRHTNAAPHPPYRTSS
jgi:SAM-dependent methyltransferase